ALRRCREGPSPAGRGRAGAPRSSLLPFASRPSRRLPNLDDGQGQPVPAVLLDRELAPPGARQRVKLRPPAGVGLAPLALDPAALLDAIERGVERPLLDDEHVPRRLLDALDDAVTVELAQAERLQDEHVQRPLEKVRPSAPGGWRPGHDAPR